VVTTPVGPVPTGIVAVTAFEAVSITDTLLLPKLVMYANGVAHARPASNAMVAPASSSRTDARMDEAPRKTLREAKTTGCALSRKMRASQQLTQPAP
jgi:hypothetical protein